MWDSIKEYFRTKVDVRSTHVSWDFHTQDGSPSFVAEAVVDRKNFIGIGTGYHLIEYLTQAGEKTVMRTRNMQVAFACACYCKEYNTTVVPYEWWETFVVINSKGYNRAE